MGNLYRKKGRSIWMMKYYRDGVPIYESSQTDSYEKALKTLKSREGAIADGKPLAPKAHRLRFDDAAEDLLNDYVINKRKSHDELERRIRLHLKPAFKGRRMASITTAEIRTFTTDRLKAGASAGEINRELTHLKRMFTLAIEGERLHRKPHIPMLREDNVRTGFFERDQVDAVLGHLPDALRPVIEFAYITGWRIASEVLPLEWRQVDFSAGEVRLDAGTTKNREGRVFPLTAALRRVLQARDVHRDELKKGGHIVARVFVRMVAEGRGGDKKPQPIVSIIKAFRAACKDAGCPGRLPHDLRRTAVRNLVRAGIPERVAMTMTGHKTRSVFERYNIVSAGDLTSAAAKLDALDGGRNGESTPQTGQVDARK
jgi:integrase